MDPRITHAIEHMHAAPETADITALAARLHLSPSRFAHLFRHETGVPPARYVRALRMYRARVLIERTSLSVKEVMCLVGCRDPSHFTRDFRRFHGMAPRECRTAATRRPLDTDDEAGGACDETAAVLRMAATANQPGALPVRAPQSPG